MTTLYKTKFGSRANKRRNTVASLALDWDSCLLRW
jgi:hypothetical protein